MYNPLPYLPEKFQKWIKKLRSLKIHPKIIFIVLGVLSTLWFLIRVIPKPSRAGYPCMQATAPYMSAFVLWLTGIGGTAFSLHHFRKNMASSKYFMALFFIVPMATFYLISQYAAPKKANADIIMDRTNYFTPNEPIGEAQGIFPGRVVWMWNPNATNENCDNTSNANGVIDEGDNAWFMDINNDQMVIDSMLTKSLLTLTESATEEESWDAIFHYFNNKNGNGDFGYIAGEKVFIKLNATTAYGPVGVRYDESLRRNDDIEINRFSAETNPYLVLSMLKQLVHQAGVSEFDIYIGDPARNIYEEFYNLWHEEFPDIHYLGNDIIQTDLDVSSIGRTPVAHTQEDKVFYSDHGTAMEDAITDKLFTIFEEMDYLINIPTLKAHCAAGITLAAKNHFGSLPRTWAVHVHAGLMAEDDDPYRVGYGLYRVQTDIMMHNLLSGKNLFMIVDGLYPSEDALGVPEKWEMQPFNNNWASSLFLSFDPVAIESVCHDFLRAEYNGPTLEERRPNWHGVDDYLHQAADSSLWPEDIIYDPDNDGILIASLGVHEHWNDSINKQYTRNLGIGNGIELIKAHEHSVGLNPEPVELMARIFPNPASSYIMLENQETQELKYLVYSSSGQVVLEGKIASNSEYRIDLSNLPNGSYLLKTLSPSSSKEFKFIKQ